MVGEIPIGQMMGMKMNPMVFKEFASEVDEILVGFGGTGRHCANWLLWYSILAFNGFIFRRMIRNISG